MGFTKKTWKNRIAEYINRRRLTMEDGSTSLVTVARDEGTISQEGDAFNAANMNDLEDRIKAGFTEVNQSLGKVLATSGIYELNHTYGCGYYKNGNVVTVTVSFGNKTIPQSGITIGTLPASYRPSINVYARNSFDNQNGELFISSNGMVHLSSSKGTFDYGHFSISFAASSNFT